MNVLLKSELRLLPITMMFHIRMASISVRCNTFIVVSNRISCETIITLVVIVLVLSPPVFVLICK